MVQADTPWSRLPFGRRDAMTAKAAKAAKSGKDKNAGKAKSDKAGKP